MKTFIAITGAALLLAMSAGAADAKGCLKGAVVGGVVGHVAGHHAVAGAVVGCVIGHHHAKVVERRREKADWEAQHQAQDHR